MDYRIVYCVCLWLSWASESTSQTAYCNDERMLEEGVGDDRFVLAGSTSQYCPAEANLVLNLSLAIPTNSSVRWEFRVELVNEDDHEDAARFACDYNATFVEWRGRGNQRGRLVRTVKINHVYSGDYVLHILRTLDSELEGRVADRKYSSRLGHFTAQVAFHHVRDWNLSVDIPPEKATEDSVLINLRHLNDSKRFGFREYQLIVRDHGIPTVVRNFTDKNIADETGRNDWNVEPISVTGLGSGNYTIQIVPLDSRCNTPRQSVNTHCPEFCERQYEIIRTKGTGNSRMMPVLVDAVSGFRNVAPIVACSIVLLILLMTATVVVIRRRSLPMEGASHAGDAEPTLLSASTTFQSVLLVYDFHDPAIRQKARLFHQELLRIGIAKVYDFGDDNQKEDVAIDTVDWFPRRIQDPTVHIIVIESDGLVQCRKDGQCQAAAPLDGLEGGVLCHALEQIRLQEISHRLLRYTRISVVSFEDVSSTSSSKLDLNPYTRFRLPDDMHLLTNQLFA